MKINKLYAVITLLALWPIGTFSQPEQAAPKLLSVKKIWDAGEHNAFTDLIRFDDRWFCTFRESEAHVGGNGKIRVLVSKNGDHWESAALLAEAGTDLRDPKFSITPDHRLMLALGGSIYEGRTLKGRQPRVAFSKNGRDWTAPQRVMQPGDWLWRVTWHQGRAYGISYFSASNANPTNEWTAKLVVSDDGLAYRDVKQFDVPGRPNEATVRFLANGAAVVLLRREGGDKAAWIGLSRAPFTEWEWQPAGLFVGGPNFIVLPDGTMIAGGRQIKPAPDGPKMFLGRMNVISVKPQLLLPSGGDCSYPGLVWHEGVLWVSYYSSHEGRSSIYLAKVLVPNMRP